MITRTKNVNNFSNDRRSVWGCCLLAFAWIFAKFSLVLQIKVMHTKKAYVGLKLLKNGNPQKQPPQVFYKNGILKNFAKFSRKHLCQSLFLNKVAENLKKTILTEHLRTITSAPKNSHRRIFKLPISTVDQLT